ncbi:hypothetical protein MIND_00906300 [Mycena indigotica]|uniref:Uncharacterized protein n=1 Tax=Mycena indigotica TaxID=2126181 RepID=A0A8H6SEB1_9AGAR|nr:uncharacterized protein MIND_00906300 [Mycena indigotica]KAF7296757.1 hypothetical protein MIND_00906300 [Mycena indigotica]
MGPTTPRFCLFSPQMTSRTSMQIVPDHNQPQRTRGASPTPMNPVVESCRGESDFAIDSELERGAKSQAKAPPILGTIIICHAKPVPAHSAVDNEILAPHNTSGRTLNFLLLKSCSIAPSHCITSRCLRMRFWLVPGEIGVLRVWHWLGSF